MSSKQLGDAINGKSIGLQNLPLTKIVGAKLQAFLRKEADRPTGVRHGRCQGRATQYASAESGKVCGVHPLFMLKATHSYHASKAAPTAATCTYLPRNETDLACQQMSTSILLLG